MGMNNILEPKQCDIKQEYSSKMSVFDFQFHLLHACQSHSMGKSENRKMHI